MKKTFLLLVFIVPNVMFAQSVITGLKIIPEFAFKLGSQDPKLGIEADLITGLVFKDTYFVGLGGGYTSDMGLGGRTYPLFIDGRIYFSPDNFLKKLGFNIQRNVLMQVYIQNGMTINTNDPYKPGLLICTGLGYRFDVLKLKFKSILPFYAGLKLEYNRTTFTDEYRGYEIADGYISQLILQLNISFDLNTIKL